MNEEIWKDIEGYEGKYQVSNFGNVRSLKHHGIERTKLLIPQKHNGGYRTVNLALHQSRKTFTIHRLVAKAFIPNPNNYGFVNHKDEDKTNNNVENLEWCTKSYNAIYYLNFDKQRKNEYAKRLRDKITGESLSPYTKHIPKTNFKKIKQYSLDGQFIKEYDNPTVASMETGYDIGNITATCKRNLEGKTKRNKKHRCGNYIWEYTDK